MDGTGLGKEVCEDMKEIVGKYGYTLICDEKEAERESANMILPADENCDNMKKVASKVGYKIVCDEEME